MLSSYDIMESDLVNYKFSNREAFYQDYGEGDNTVYKGVKPSKFSPIIP